MKFDDVLNHDDKFRYMLLSRMQGDCDYYLGNGRIYGNHLWAGDEVKQIAYMKALWNSFSEDEKPEWLSYEQILDYEQKIGIKAILVEMDYKGYYERFALTPEEFEKEFPETFERFSPIEESNSDTLKPMVHIWFEPCVVGDASWERHFSDMEWGLPESDIESANLATVRFDHMQTLKKFLPEDVVIDVIRQTSDQIVNQFDWSMPRFDSKEYDGNNGYGEYENDCLDIGHERRSEICGLVIENLVTNGVIDAGDESYYEIIDEEVWEDITTCIVRNQVPEPSYDALIYHCKAVFQHDNLPFAQREIELQVLSAVEVPDYTIENMKCVEEMAADAAPDFPDDYIFTFEFDIKLPRDSQTNIKAILNNVDGGELLSQHYERSEEVVSLDDKIKNAKEQATGRSDASTPEREER